MNLGFVYRSSIRGVVRVTDDPHGPRHELSFLLQEEIEDTHLHRRSVSIDRTGRPFDFIVPESAFTDYSILAQHMARWWV